MRLNNALERLFLGYSSGGGYYSSDFPITLPHRYLEMPIQKETIEIPIIALSAFLDTVGRGEKMPDAYVHKLPQRIREFRYKSLDANMRNALVGSLLCGIKIKRGGEDHYYYLDRGVIYNENLEIMMLCSWVIKPEVKEGTTVYRIQYPLIRVDARCVTPPDDPMKRYIMNKIVPTAVQTSMYLYREQNIIMDTHGMNPQIIIGEMPYKLKIPDMPSINTSNKELIEIVTNHLTA